MKVSIVGSGYVGTTTALCLAELGHETVNVDIDPDVVDGLNSGVLHIHEPGLQKLLDEHLGSRFYATTDYGVVGDTDITFICLPTPSCEDGGLDLSVVLDGARELGKALMSEESHMVVVKSTVLPGSTKEVGRVVLEKSGLRKDSLLLACNPEFLREGTAVYDFMEPDRIVLGGDEEAVENLKQLYRPLIDDGFQVFETDVKTAEMVKYASNSLLATKISFANEVGNICKKLDIDSYEVMDGVGLDKRVERSFLDSGVGFGGSCLPTGERVLVEVDGELKYIPIEKLHSLFIKDCSLKAYSLDLDTGSREFKEITTVTERPYNDVLVEVFTESGRSLKATEDHPFIVQDGGWSVKPAINLSVGDEIPLIGEFPVNPVSIDFLEIIEKHGVEDVLIDVGGEEEDWVPVDEAVGLDMSEKDSCNIKGLGGGVFESPCSLGEDIWMFIGSFINFGDTEQLIDNGMCVFRTMDADNLDPVYEFLNRFEVPYTITPGDKNQLSIENQLAGALLKEFCIGVYGKKIPEQVFQETTDNKKAFLKGIFPNYSGGRGEAQLIIGPELQLLGEQLSLLLESLDIDTTIKRSSGSELKLDFEKTLGSKEVRNDIKISRTERLRIFREKNKNGEENHVDRVVEIDRYTEDVDVHSVEVEDNQSFTASYGIIIHNCFPKDVRALKSKAVEVDEKPDILDAVLKTNQKQPQKIVEMLESKIGELKNKKIAVLGLAFKPGTDDIRESRALPVIKTLKQKNTTIYAHDPKASENMMDVFPDINYEKTPEKALNQADACLILTDWEQYKKLDIDIPCIEGRRLDKCEGLCW
ncbi:UDP-glucose 6-dehydrogenase, aglM/ugd [Methanonatronarchaeum thermophilum]|uniref:UDP-glucose 6-dehydrogenase, aglM/ugd n=1 Tax=Methanonatronarchaeum thermophilum TaxID=1927129 RepID=A0A1Y3GAM2_9EURY|nr:nucleotide sugar dehydrogenase [Methanonatronarchaeum thermophilum]OUJ18468.1 UDP-glucose 6-dehydrogenase, aglM/ugd [Methanonatronarchaeum thermophilum]